MRLTTFAVTTALLTLASAQQYSNGSVTYSIETVTGYTTYCPSPTLIVHGNYSYTVTEATTLTITNCPCMLTHTIPLPTVALANTTAAASSPTVTLIPNTPAALTYANATVLITTAPSAAILATSTVISPAIHTGAAMRMEMGAGAATLAGFFGLVAFLL